jgi:hypothetical protein
LYRGIVTTRTGCITHTFAADVVFRRQHFATTSGYMRKQPQIDCSDSCVGHAERKRNVKKILLTTTALIALGIAPAAAADLAARPYTKAPAAAIAINNWSGFYIGAMGGYAQENSSGIGTLSGGFAGGTVGYNWQTGNFVLGVEADAAWADVGATVGVFGGLAGFATWAPCVAASAMRSIPF